MKITIALLTALLTALRAVAAPVDFVREVRPIFEKNCYACHGAQKQKSGLRLDVKAAALKGGDAHGALLVAGKATDSVLLKLVTSADKDERMPPQGDGLSADEVATLTRWINEGAPCKKICLCSACSRPRISDTHADDPRTTDRK